ncbi:glycine-rich protein 23 [Strongylocentrotus purpuratus]|uniref:Uncharacterized protein n=1 Tax=Strongylocentrotus purpuratus TaxID=7668 RepID=A0A7M7GGJ6_STRPU|nr:glycine-rich protein 23 [Strongylocentrotus purpuratus]|eukprot:XP_003725275.1 PREDICTED: ATP-dependent RNA helicase A-like [Strongylocentrotus purpuratus]
MKMQLLAVCLLMPILACSAQFDWLLNYRQLNAGAPQRQTEFGFMKPSTTPKPFGMVPKQRRDGNLFGLGAAANDFAGGSSTGSYTPLDTAPVENPALAGTGDTSGNGGSDWGINTGGADYGGNSGGTGHGGTGGVSGGAGGGMGGGSGVAGGSFADGGNPGYDDSMQNLANGASAGSIAGIVIGVIILLSVLAGVSFFVMRQVHRKVQANVTSTRA